MACFFRETYRLVKKENLFIGHFLRRTSCCYTRSHVVKKENISLYLVRTRGSEKGIITLFPQNRLPHCCVCLHSSRLFYSVHAVNSRLWTCIYIHTYIINTQNHVGPPLSLWLSFPKHFQNKPSWQWLTIWLVTCNVL